MPRIFVALPVPLDVARALLSAVPDDPALRPLPAENVHLTLAFIGTIDEARVDDVVAAVHDAAADARSFDVAFERIGRFPPTGRPRAVSADIGGSAALVAGLGERVRAALELRRIAFDPKPLVPHITLARVADRPDGETARRIVTVLCGARLPAGLRGRADAVHVVESTLSPRGARYSARARVPLPDRIEG